MRILIADDHAIVRDGLKTLIGQLGPNVEVFEAASFTDVIALIDTVADLSLLVLDLHMPGMEPLAGLEAVRHRTSGRIAVLSADCDVKTIGTVLSAGVSGYIPKDLGIPAIISALKLVMAGETFVPSAILQATDRMAFSATITEARAADGFTARERDVLALLLDGLSNKGIARQLDLSEVTVKTHLGNAFRKLGVQNRVQAVRAWQRIGLK